jgi:hypothetical protein
VSASIAAYSGNTSKRSALLQVRVGLSAAAGRALLNRSANGDTTLEVHAGRRVGSRGGRDFTTKLVRILESPLNIAAVACRPAEQRPTPAGL